MNEKDLPFEHSETQSKTDRFLYQKTNFWAGSRRRAIQLLAAGAGVTATLGFPAFGRGNIAIAREAGSKGMNNQANQRLEPNLFELQGYDAQIVYSTSSIKGIPQLSYFTRDQERTFSGEDIQSEETGFGRSVTVLLQNGAADEPIESLTLLLPIVQLSSQVRELPIQTLAILSRRAVFVNPNAPLQLQTYDTLSLSGTAKLVQL